MINYVSSVFGSLPSAAGSLRLRRIRSSRNGIVIVLFRRLLEDLGWPSPSSWREFDEMEAILRRHQLMSVAQLDAPVTSERATDGADTTARQNSPVNAVGWRPPSGSAPISEEARRHLVAAAPAGRAERSAAA